MRETLKKAGGWLQRLRWERFLTAGIAVVVLLVAVRIVVGGPELRKVTQPVRFSHALHARLNATCDVCHRRYETGQAAGRPTNEVCMDCHDPEDDPLGESPEEEVLRGLLREGKEIPWKRLLALAPDVRFSHVRHVVKGQVPCERCHGPIGESESPPEVPLHLFSMDDCLSCHEQNEKVKEGEGEQQVASTDCLACHR